jgi:integrase
MLENADKVEWVDMILIVIYTGARISEMLKLTRFNIDLENQIITGGIKTDAGKNRSIPIHPKISKYTKAWYDKNGETLICREDGKKLNKAGTNKTAIQKLIGHSDYATTANIYTHPDIEELRKAINMI